MNLMRFKIGQLLSFIEDKPWIVFIFLGILVFVLFRSLFSSFFEADEWFHFTYYLPLTKKPDGFLTAILSTFTSAGALSGGQHVIPIASAIYFLNTKFFGLNYPPYAFMSLLLHSINSFLVFLLIKTLLNRTETFRKNIFAVLGSIFFAFSPTPIHAVTGAAPFYGQNILSVTFFLLCIIFFKKAFLQGSKKIIYLSIIFLFLSLFTKETAVFLFLLLPFMAVIEKRIFPMKFLGKVFAISLVVYLIFRFVIPNLQGLPGKIIDKFMEGYIPKSYTQQGPAQDTEIITNKDISIYKNLPAEIMFRSITFPLKMTGTLFLPRQNVFTIVQIITPIVQPVPPGGDSADSSQARLGFLYGPGNGFIIYIVSLVILIFCSRKIFKFISRRRIQEAQALATGIVVIIMSSLPLVAIIFSFPRWGYDFYFDSRFYYNPNVGAAIVFPFLLFGLAEFVSKQFRIRNASFVVFTLFIIWLINNMNMFNLGIKQFTQNFQPDRREVVRQLKEYLPILPQKIVFYIETDSLSAYGPILPFQTSVPQALTVVYYDRSPLPDSFFNKPLFNGKSEGYLFSESRGFGYYISKKDLGEALLRNDFKISDIYAFYYKAQDVRLLDVTADTRQEMKNYLTTANKSQDWKILLDPLSNLSFSYPTKTQIRKTEDGKFILNDTNFSAEISVFKVSQTFDINEFAKIRTDISGIVNSKKVSYDRFHYNDALIISGTEAIWYLVKLNDKLIQVKTNSFNQGGILILEKILGSFEISFEK